MLIHASVDSALATGQAGLLLWVRGDGRTVAMHTEALARKQKVINVYVALARLVADRAAAAGRLDPEARARVEAGLHGHVEGEDAHERLSCSGGWDGVREVASSAELRAATDAARQRGAGVGLVPTMGALHAGHPP